MRRSDIGVVAWIATASLVVVALGLLTNLVTSDDPAWWVVTGFAIAAAASIVLPACQAVVVTRRQRTEGRKLLQALLQPFPGPVTLVSGMIPATIPALLDPASSLAPFVGRTAEHRSLLQWCIEGEEPIRLLEGASGVGKTRLAIEVSRSLPGNWISGVPRTGSYEKAMEAALKYGQHVLLVVDDADLIEETGTLVDLVYSSVADVRIRLLLLVRDAAALLTWLNLRRQSRQQYQFNRTVLVITGGDRDRARWFVAALKNFASALGQSERPELTEGGVGPVGKENEPILLTLLRAALAVLDGSTPSAIEKVRQAGTRELAEMYIDHEQIRWGVAAEKAPYRHAVGSISPDGRLNVILSLSLSGVSGIGDAQVILERTPLIHDQLNDTRNMLAMWAAELYPARNPMDRGPLVSPWPEYLSAVIIAYCADPSRYGVVQAIDFDSVIIDKGSLSHRLVRAASWFQDAANLIGEALRQAPSAAGLIVQAVTLSGIASRRSLDSNVAPFLLPTAISSEESARLLALSAGKGLPRTRVALARVHNTHRRASARRFPTDENRVANAQSLIVFAECLRDLRQYRPALEADREATGILRSINVAAPGSYARELAGALISSAESLGLIGDRRLALSAAQEAIDLLRGVNVAAPGSHTQELAEALVRLAKTLDSVGDERLALAAAQEATDLLRRVNEAVPGSCMRELAEALVRLAVNLRSLGDVRLALAPAREATDILREANSAEPDSCTPELIEAMLSLGTSQRLLGDFESAVESSREATALARRLVGLDPAGYLENLGNALTSYGLDLVGLGRLREALKTDAEAVEVHRRLYLETPTRHPMSLAQALMAYSAALVRSGNPIEGARSRSEAVELYREAIEKERTLAASEPKKEIPQLAITLISASVPFVIDGEADEAVSVIVEAVEILRILARVEPKHYLPLLINALFNYASILRGRGSGQDVMNIYAELLVWDSRLMTLKSDNMMAALVDNARSQLATLSGGRPFRWDPSQWFRAEESPISAELPSSDPEGLWITLGRRYGGPR